MNIHVGGTVFAFGDSLTEGMGHQSMFRNKSSYHPYTIALAEHLPHSTVIESGLSGEVVGHMRTRLKSEIMKREFTEPIVVVILGGTNDIGMRHPVSATVTDIIGMHQDLKVLQKSKKIIHTVAMTVPTFPSDRNREARLAVNDAIRSYADQSGGFTLLLDIEDLFVMQPCKRTSKTRADDMKCIKNEIPYDPQNQQFWDRHSSLHFSESGYDALGRIVYERLCEGKSYFTK